MKWKQVLIVIICAALVIALAFFWNELKKEPLDLKMYGAEISADGTVIQETEFHIMGYLKEIHNDVLSAYKIYHEPITFKDIPDVIISLESYQGDDLTVYNHGDASDPNYVFISFSYDPVHNWIDFPSIYLCGEMCCCIIEVHDGRYFVGSTDPDYDIEKILSSMPEVELDGAFG